ncbi:hypothetical protein MKW98_020626 [Papaver atlanticum]|uniref:Transposase Tnp1/En/Spm-like domain-containing protein n=1 Tax=Papaver atlanticum TaxID=357466 RepID=A0AAD4XXE4_9MAGN|nr:hypothetical protein MKW98_020626 [Papaver atlanticum]
MRSKRLELQEALKKQKLSTERRGEALQNQRLSTTKPRARSVNNGGKEKEVVTDAVDEGLDGRRENEIVTDAVDERLNTVAVEKPCPSTAKPHISLVDGQRGNVIVTDAVDERPNAAAALERLRSSTTKACAAIVDGSWADEIVNIAVDASINAVALKKQTSSAKKSRSAVGNVRIAKQIGTDAVDETCNAVSLEKQKSPATNSRSAFVNDRRAKEVVTDAVDEGLNHGSAKEIGTDAVDERLNNVAIERSSATKPHSTFVNVSRENEAVNERVNVIALEKERSSATKPFSASINGRKGKETRTDAVVGERLNAVALEKQRSLTIKPRITFVHGRRAKEIGTDTVDARLNPDALEKQRLSITKPCSAFVNHSKESEIVTNPVDERLNAVDDILDSGSDIRDGDTDTLDTWSDIRDEDADMVVSGSATRDQDVDILDADRNDEMQFAEDQSLPFNSNEDADILDAAENGDMQILDDQSLPTNSEQVAGSSRKRNRETVRRQVTDPHSESYNANCTDNGQGSISMPSDRRIPIKFDKYGRPCDVGSVAFATYIGKIVRACCRPAIESWTRVPNSVKDTIWKNVINMYAVPEIYKPNVLSRAGMSWRNWKHNLRLELDEQKTIAERKKYIPCRLITKREDWESFVDFCNTDEDRKRRAAGKKACEAVELIQKCGRTGIYRKIYEMEKESPTGEVNRAAIFVDTHVSKTVNDPKMRLVKELVEANPDGQNDIDHDAVALVYGRDSSFIKGMGAGVSRTKIRTLAASSEILRRVQQENKSLQSDIHVLRTQLGVHTPNHTSTPSNQSVAQTQIRTSALSNQSAPYTQNRTSTPSNQYAPQTQISTPTPSNQSALHTHSRTSRPSNQFASQALEASNLPARSRFVPDVSNLPTRSCLAPPASNLPAMSCFIKNFKGRTIALGSINTADPPMENVYSLVIEEIFDRDAELFDEDGKLGDVMIGGVINWPKACVEFNLPANSCFIRNFKRRTIAFGSINTAESPMEHVYSVIVKEIFDRDAELFDEDGKLGDIMNGGLINWPKACIKPC